MPSQSNLYLVSLLKSFSRAASLTAILIGGLVLVGWSFDIGTLKSVLPDLPNMMANTALGLGLAGVSLWLHQREEVNQWRHHVAQGVAFAVVLVGLLTLSEYLFGWGLGIDQLLFKDTAMGATYPGRPSPHTALTLVLIGLALLLLDVETMRGYHPAQFLAFVAVLIPLTALIGYMYNVLFFYGITSYTGMAVHTAVGFAVLCFGILSTHPDRGLMVVLTSGHVGSVTARRLLLAAVGILLVLGWLRVKGEVARLYDASLGASMLALSSIVVFTVLIWVTARSLNRADIGRKLAEDELRKHQEHLEELVAERTMELEQARDSLIKKTHDMAGLIKAGKAVSSSLNLENVLCSIVVLTAQVMNVSRCSLMLLDEKGEYLEWRTFIGFPEEFARIRRVRVSESLAGIVATQGRPLSVLDIASDPRAAHRDLVRKYGFISYLGVPIRVKGKTIGVLNIYTKEPHAFSEEEIELLSTFADQAGIAIDHATLYGRLEERAKELNRELICEKEFAETVLRSIADGVYVTDLERRILSWSDGSEAITGFRTEEVAGRFCGDFIKHTDDEGRVLCDFACPLNECFQIGRPTAVKDMWVHTADGRRALVSVSAAPIRNEEGRIIGAVEVFRDISKERELVRRIQEASRHKSAFLANMSHELRTPLNSIIGFSEVLIDGMAGELNEKQARYINNVLTSGRHLLDLINDILDLSKVEAGKLEFQPEAFGISDALEGAITLVRPMASMKGLHMEFEVDERLSTINADPVRFKQIMTNLLSNAIKFTPEGGKVRVAAQLVSSPQSPVFSKGKTMTEDRGLKTEDWVQISVSDTGVGIKPGDMPRLFQEFVQLDSTYAKRHQGTGLGLSLTKKLVELHGGRIWAESGGEGKGSTFTFVLPLGKGD